MIFLTPDHEKFQTRECHCGQFGASFAPRTPTASPFLPENISKKTSIFGQHFFPKLIPYASPAHLHRWKRTANGSSNHDFFMPKLSKKHPNMIPKSSQNDPKIIPKSSQNYPKIIPRSSQNHPKIIPKSSQNHPKMVPK